MANTTLDGEFYVTNGTLDNQSSPTTITTTGTQKVVKISATQIEHSFEKSVISFQVPIRKNDQQRNGGTGEPITQIIDILKDKETVSVRGVLAQESGSTALSKKNDLKTIIERGGTFTIVWGVTSTAQVMEANLIKWQCREVVGEQVIGGGNQAVAHADLVRKFEIDAQFLVGTDR